LLFWEKRDIDNGGYHTITKISGIHIGISRVEQISAMKYAIEEPEMFRACREAILTLESDAAREQLDMSMFPSSLMRRNVTEDWRLK